MSGLIIVLVILTVYTVLVAIDSDWAGGAIFDRARWPIVATAWGLIIIFWLGSAGYGVYVERNALRKDVKVLMEAIEPYRGEIKAKTGEDPLAKFVVDSDGESDTESKR